MGLVVRDIFKTIISWFFSLVTQNFRATHKTLPEAQRTQGIDSITWIVFLTEMNLYVFILASEIIQVSDSIPWVHCASGNVCFIQLLFFGKFTFKLIILLIYHSDKSHAKMAYSSLDRLFAYRLILLPDNLP